MKDTLELLNAFEKRNNISTSITTYSDGTGTVNEFWDGEELIEFKNTHELHEFLSTTQYKLSENGRCVSPVEKVYKYYYLKPGDFIKEGDEFLSIDGGWEPCVHSVGDGVSYLLNTEVRRKI